MAKIKKCDGVNRKLERQKIMLDIVTKEPLRISPNPGSNPSLRLPHTQVGQVTKLLDQHGIRYWVDSHIISMNGGPYIGSIYFYRETDPNKVQAILDTARQAHE